MFSVYLINYIKTDKTFVYIYISNTNYKLIMKFIALN